MTTSETATQQAESAAMAGDLRHVADMIEQNPELFDLFRYCFNNINVFPRDDKSAMAKVIRAALAHGATVEKGVKGKFFAAGLHFGRVVIDVNAEREEVCERVVVGTETVTTEVPDPKLLAEVPKIEVTETIEQVEWRCRPLLASDAGGAS